MAPEVLKILAVDDLPDNLITLKAVLRDALPAARVLTAASGPAGIALARAEDPDVILLDIIMPEMDGFAVCRALKADEHTAAIPVVFLTALRSDRKNRMEALEAGAEGFLAKPLDEIELVAQIRVMAKIKAANRAQRSEQERLAALVAERTRELKQQLAARVHAEALERKQAAKLNSIYRAAPAGIGMVINRMIQDANDTLCEMTGYARAELLGRSARFLYPTDADYDFVGDEKYRQIAQSGSGTVETRWRRKDGAIIDILLSSAALDPADLTRGVSFTALDITERKRAEAALRESEERYRRLTDNARDIIFRYSLVPEMRLTYINPAVEELTGYSPAECYADPQLMLNLVHPADRPMMAGFMATLSAPDQPFTMRWIGKDGVTRWMESKVVPVYDAAGRLVAVEGITRDMTARKLTEEALQESEARHRAIFENMAAACCVDEVIFENGQAVDYRILDVNPAFERITGIPRSQAAGALASAVYGTGQAPFLDIYSRVAATGEPAAFEAHFAPIEKDLYITVGAPGPGRFSTVFSDITERKQAEKALRASEELARRLLAQQVAINQLALALGESLDLNAVYRTIHQHIQGMLDVWCFIISSYDAQTKLIRAEYAADERVYDVTVFPPIPLGPPDSGTQSRVIHSGQLLYTPDHWQAINQSNVRYTIEQDGTVHEEQLSEREKDTTRSAVYLPMKIKGQTVGILQVQSRRLDAYSPDDINLLAGMANVAVVAIQNARLHQDVLHELQERQRAEAALFTERTLLRTLVDNLPDSIYVKDIACRKTLANPANLHHIGATTEADVLGKTDFDLFPRDLATAFNTDDLQVMQTGQSILNREERVTLPDGSRGWQMTSKVPLRDSAGQVIGLVGIGHDITERVRAEDKLRETLAELQRSNADLERFAYIASHDLQEPLRMVSSYAQLLDINYRGRLDADADEFIGYLVEGAMRMHQLLLDLLDYSSINPYSSHPQPTDAAVSYEMALNNLAPLIAGNAATITCDPLPTVLADVAQLTQLFQNLIGNAIKFHGAEPPVVHVSARAKDDGESTMDDGRSTMDDAHRTSNIAHRTSGWVFSVRDNGIGIEPQYFERIFVVFQRLHTRRKYQGNGIGLAICKRIIERHGGRIWVESAPEQGSTFYFTLPAVI